MQNQVKDSYYNMKESLKNHRHLVENACEIFREMGTEPKVCAIRKISPKVPLDDTFGVPVSASCSAQSMGMRSWNLKAHSLSALALSVSRRQPHQKFCHLFHGLYTGKFKTTVDIGAAGAEIRAGKPHAGKPCAVRS